MSAKNEGLGLGYRLGWRLNYVLLHVAGPATLSEELDPRSRMRRERAARVARVERQVRELRASRFTAGLQRRAAELHSLARSDGMRPDAQRAAA